MPYLRCSIMPYTSRIDSIKATIKENMSMACRSPDAVAKWINNALTTM